MTSNALPEQGAPLPLSPASRSQAADEQLLGAFRHLLGHELPNQMIALQGLLRVLELDEADRLAPAGKDLLARLGTLAQEIHALVHRMAELCRLRQPSEPPESFSLTELAREAAAEISQLSPGRTIGYDFPVVEVARTGPRSLLRRAVVELGRWMIEAEPAAQACRLRFEAAVESGTVIFRVAQLQSRPAPEAVHELRQALVDPAAETSAKRLGLLLVRQVIDRAGGIIEVDGSDDQGVRVTIRWPQGIKQLEETA
jgi:signal transduction histidine kinase